ncbi:MAG: hypothetical protein NWE95_09035 [Candidatus Bathyarchaeota archaeon]|nr:hypothetical protein [Candidatus Bathyarchaeota archaeon]
MSPVEYMLFRILRQLRKLPVNILGIGNPKVIFTDYFKGFENIPAVQGIFGEKTSEVLRNLVVELSWVSGYMYVDGSDGHLVISKNYLTTGNKTDIYLDLIHELYHVKQFLEGRELFDTRYDYVERPTEIEAYRYVVQEARRLGLSEERICSYLRTEWMSEYDLKKLAKSVNLSC